MCTDLNDNSSEDPGYHWGSEAGESVVGTVLVRRDWIRACIALQWIMIVK